MLIIEDSDPNLSCGYYGEDWSYKGKPLTGKIVERHQNGNIVCESEYLESLLCKERTFSAKGNLEREYIADWKSHKFEDRRYHANGTLTFESFLQSKVGKWEIHYTETGEIISGVGEIFKLIPPDTSFFKRQREHGKWDNFFSPVTLNIYDLIAKTITKKKA